MDLAFKINCRYKRRTSGSSRKSLIFNLNTRFQISTSFRTGPRLSLFFLLSRIDDKGRSIDLYPSWETSRGVCPPLSRVRELVSRFLEPSAKLIRHGLVVVDSSSFFFPRSSHPSPTARPLAMMGSIASPRACVSARYSITSSSTALRRVADGGGGTFHRLRSSHRRFSSTRARAASDPPPLVSKTTYSTPTEASPNAEDDEDLLQYPDRARWVRVDLESIFLHVVDLDLVN